MIKSYINKVYLTTLFIHIINSDLLDAFYTAEFRGYYLQISKRLQYDIYYCL